MYGEQYFWRRMAGSAYVVYGAIEAWSDEGGEAGRFFLHPFGFRAQYAKPVLLAPSSSDPDHVRLVRWVARRYGTDVSRLKHLEDAAKEHGQLVPDELLYRLELEW